MSRRQMSPHFGQNAQVDQRRIADAPGAAVLSLGRPCPLDRAIGMEKRQAGLCGECFSGRCQSHVSLGSLEKLCAKVAFQFADLFAQRRLSDMQTCGCARKVEDVRKHNDIAIESKLDTR